MPGRRKHKKKKYHCPDHGARLVGAQTAWGYRRHCPVDGCTVACWNGHTSTPANGQTRQLRRACHEAFDKIWQLVIGEKLGKARARAYKWLARRMDLDPRQMHFGYFDSAMCRAALEFIRARIMLTFEDGPAKGKLLASTRVPFLLRVAVDAATDECSPLDELHMMPVAREDVYTYILLGHIDKTGRDGPSGIYRLFDHQAPFSIAANRDAWTAWCLDMANGPARETAKKAALELTHEGEPIK